MPYDVKNKITFTGSQKDIDKIFMEIQSEKYVIDFNKIIPIPKDKENDWYDWCIEKWGTKWIAYEQSKDGNSILFETAWNPPTLIFVAITDMIKQKGYDVQFKAISICCELIIGSFLKYFSYENSIISNEKFEITVDNEMECETLADVRF